MNPISQPEIEKLRHQLNEDGVMSPELLDDLLDHYCCAIEEELNNGLSREAAFELVHQRICPNGAGEIQEMTDYLLNYKFISTMRALMYSLGFLSAFVFTLGWLFNIFHWQGGQIMFMTGPLIFSGGFLPVYIMYQVRDKDKKTLLEWVTYSSGTIVAAVLTLGGLFKFAHWPGANVLVLLGMGTLAFAFLPSLFLLLYKRSGEAENMLKEDMTS